MVRRQRLTLQQWMVPLGPPLGAVGPNTALLVELNHGCPTSARRPAANYCWDFPPGLKLDSLGKAGRLVHNLLKGLASCGTRLCAGGIPQSPPRWSRPQPGSALYPPPQVLPGPRPCSCPQVALPVHTIDMAASAQNDMASAPLDQATAHLIVLAFYFLLRVGEYTLPLENHTTRTVQFRHCNFLFWQGQCCCL